MIPPLPRCAWLPALPTPMKSRPDGEVIEWGEHGLTIIDHFAGLAMQSLRTQKPLIEQLVSEARDKGLSCDDLRTYIDDRVAYLAYHQAAAMCRAKEKLQ